MTSARPTASDSAPADTSDREIVVTRVFDAPRALVFKAWTDPKHLAHWWGPNGFSITTYEMEFKPGGTWRFVMHGPDGRDYKNEQVYVEIVEPERLVYRHVPTPQFQMTVTFVDDGGKTKLTAQMLFESATLRDQTVKTFGAVEGLKQTLGRLAEHVTNMKGGPTMTHNAEVTVGDRELTITRIFDAPRPLVFFAWSTPKHLMRWFAPNNFTVPECEMDFRDGGKFRLCMRGLGRDYWMNGVFREIVRPERIVWSSSLDNDTNEVVTTVTFTVMGGKTRLTVHQTYSIETDSTRGAPQGWTETLDHLAQLLADA
jgi:uncharacterized protein YndB with AHSA1/START domain